LVIIFNSISLMKTVAKVRKISVLTVIRDLYEKPIIKKDVIELKNDSLGLGKRGRYEIS